MTISFGHGLSVTPLQLAAATLPLVNGGIAVTPTTSEQFEAHVKSEIAKWTKVVKAAKLEAE